MPLLDHVQQVLLRKAHRDVFYHHSCESLNAVEDRMEIYHVVNKFCDFVHLGSRRLRLLRRRS